MQFATKYISLLDFFTEDVTLVVFSQREIRTVPSTRVIDKA